MHTLTTADLPAAMRLAPDTAATAEARRHGLTIACRHGATTCTPCLVAAARRVVEAADRAVDQPA